MSCLRIKISVQRAGNAVTCVQPFGSLSASVEGGRMTVQADGSHGSLQADVIDGGSVSAYLVCKAGKDVYLRVKPVETMWVSVGYDIDYNVRSNTDWIVQ